MNELIKVEKTIINDEEVNSINLRDLHKFVGSKQDYSNYAKNRLTKYGFVKNNDYIVFNKFIENSSGGRPEKEYIVTLDTAKEIAMVENNEQGRKIRQYFIEIEKQSKKQILTKSPEEIEAIRFNNFRDRITATAEDFGLTDNSKILFFQEQYQQKGYPIPKLIPSLEVNKESYIYKRTEIYKAFGTNCSAALGRLIKPI
jgi:phage anti-repressor protein